MHLESCFSQLYCSLQVAAALTKTWSPKRTQRLAENRFFAEESNTGNEEKKITSLTVNEIQHKFEMKLI